MKASIERETSGVLDLALLENILLSAAMHLVYTSPGRAETDIDHDKLLQWIKANVGEQAAEKFTQMANINRIYTKDRNKKIVAIQQKNLLPARYFPQEVGKRNLGLFKSINFIIIPRHKAHVILKIIMRFYITAKINPDFNLDTAVKTDLRDFPQITLLGFAALICSPALITDLIDRGASFKIEFKYCPLRVSIQNNYPELTDWLLEKKYHELTDANICDLYYICFEQSFQACFNAMIKHKLYGNLITTTNDKQAIDDRKFMVCITGIICQRLGTDKSQAKVLTKMLATLCQAGFRVDGVDPETKSCHLIALLLHAPDVLEVLVIHGKTNDKAFLDTVYHIPYLKFDGTLLTAAAVFGHTHCLRLLLQAGANPNLPLEPTRHRPWAMASPINSEARKLLLEYKAQPVETGIRLDFGLSKNNSERHSQRPLIDAICIGSVDGVKTALQYGESPNLTEVDSRSPLCYALQSYSEISSSQRKKERHELVALLLQSGADINAAIDRDLPVSALALICLEDIAELIPVAFQHGADIHFQHPNVPSALHLCCHEANIATLTMIAKHLNGVIYRAVEDFFGAAYYAIMNHQYLMIQELLRYFNFDDSPELEQKIAMLAFDAILKFQTLGQAEQKAYRSQLDSMLVAIIWRFKIVEIKPEKEITEQSLDDNKLALINKFLSRDLQSAKEFLDFIHDGKDFLFEIQQLLSKEAQIQEKWRFQIVDSLKKFCELKNLKIQWRYQGNRFYGQSHNIIKNAQLFDGLFQNAGILVQLTQNNVILQVIEPNPIAIMALCDRLIQTEQVTQVAANSDKSQSGLAYLTGFFGSVQGAKEFQAASIQNTAGTPTPLVIAATPTIITWANGLIQSTDLEIQHLTNLDHYVLYSKELMSEQGCSAEVFDCLSQVLAAGSERNACLKRLKGQMPTVTIQIGTEIFKQLPITLESRNNSRKERFMLAPLLSDCKRHILYVSVCYLSNGLHEKSALTQMTERCQRVILIPWKKPALESEESGKMMGPN